MGVVEPNEQYPRGWVHIAEFRSHTYRNIQGLEPRTLGDHRRATNQTPEWLEPFRTLVTGLFVARQEELRLRRVIENTPPVPVAPSEPVVTIPEGLVNQLREFAQVVDDARFDDLLNAHGIGRGTAYDVRVVISGHGRFMPAVETVAEVMADAIGADFTISAVSGEPIITTWVRAVNVVKYGNDGCACRQVTREDLTQYLPSGWADWEFEAQTCAVR